MVHEISFRDRYSHVAVEGLAKEHGGIATATSATGWAITNLQNKYYSGLRGTFYAIIHLQPKVGGLLVGPLVFTLSIWDSIYFLSSIVLISGLFNAAS